MEKKSRLSILYSALTKPYTDKEGIKQKAKLTHNELMALVGADPTTRLNGVNLETTTPEDFDKVKAGKYAKWLIKQYLNLRTELKPGERGYDEELKRQKEIFIEDLYKFSTYLKKYERFKNRIGQEYSDINKLNIEMLYDLTKDFNLELAETTKAERKQMSVHPGAKLGFEGKEWRVIVIEDKGELGKEAACYYGGYNTETEWCTSAPGLTHFNSYINRGNLYVVYKHTDTNVAPKTGLPVERYQFHFEDSQFMDRRDRSIDLVEELNGRMSELKEYFKPKFVSGMITPSGNRLIINSLTSGSTGKFVALYGLEELFDAMPDNLIAIEIMNNSDNIEIEIPPTITKFKQLNTIIFDRCVKSLPKEIAQLKNLAFITLRDNKKLKSIPEEIANMENLLILNLRGTNVKLPKAILDKSRDIGEQLYDFTNF